MFDELPVAGLSAVICFLPVLRKPSLEGSYSGSLRVVQYSFKNKTKTIHKQHMRTIKLTLRGHFARQNKYSMIQNQKLRRDDVTTASWHTRPSLSRISSCQQQPCFHMAPYQLASLLSICHQASYPPVRT